VSDMLSDSRAAGSPGEGELAVTQVAGAVMPAASIPPPARGGGDFLHYALHNRKLVFGLSLELLFVLSAIFGPFISPHDTTEFFLPHQPPSAQHWMGTDYFGHDRVFDLLRGAYFSHLGQQAWHAKIESALGGVALNPGDVLGRYPHQLSGGQQQRLLIARALLLDVRLLIADEIISMLDASTRVDILNLLVSLKRSGLAILFITHDLSLGNYVSDRTVILRRGAIAEMGDSVKVFGNPQHPYTRDLLAAVPELRKKWQPGDGEAAFPDADAASARPATPVLARHGHARRLTRADRPPQPAASPEAPPLERFEDDHFVAAEPVGPG
jgi:ABC transporter/Oligopeptide/dipeptide transporter, C-terminal region